MPDKETLSEAISELIWRAPVDADMAFRDDCKAMGEFLASELIARGWIATELHTVVVKRRQYGDLSQ